MRTSTVMKKQGLRYFSSLTSSQKDKTIMFIVKSKLGVLGLSDGLEKIIVSNMFDKFIETRNFVEEKIKNQKCFKHENNFYPLNIKEILQ